MDQIFLSQQSESFQYYYYLIFHHIPKRNYCLFSENSPSPAPRARPVPAGGRPKPNLKSSKPRATALYDYSAGDTDEINLFQGEIIEIFQEGLLQNTFVFSSVIRKTWSEV